MERLRVRTCCRQLLTTEQVRLAVIDVCRVSHSHILNRHGVDVERQVNDRIATTYALERLRVRTCCRQFLTTKQVRLAVEDVCCVSHSHILNRHGVDIQRQVNDRIATTYALERLRVRTCYRQLLTTEQVRLAVIDVRRVCYSNRRRSRRRSLHGQREGNGAVALATHLLQRVRLRCVRSQLLAPEQVYLSGLDRSGIRSSFQCPERKVHGHCAISKRIGVRTVRRQLVTAKQVRYVAAHGRRILRVYGSKRSCTEKRQQGYCYYFKLLTQHYISFLL